tara:strand:+ start:655 stop:1401 length:747 start_codon:yes stop_codon:yes gene_type:complete
MKNIIVSGCSYSQNCGDIPYPHLIDKKTTSSVTNLAWPGQGNDSIIRIINEQIQNGVTDTLFICQLSYLHRLSMFCNANQKWIDFQPSFINQKPEMVDGKVEFSFDIDIKHNIGGMVVYKETETTAVGLPNEEYKNLMNWYETYMTLIYDEEHRFNSLMESIDTLNYKVDKSGNKILYIYWPHEIVNINELKNRNFFNIDGEYSMLKWSTENEMINTESHLSDKGHVKLTELLINEFGLVRQKYTDIL